MDLQLRVQERMRAWLPSKTRVLCAVSGGPDSVALAHALKTLPFFLVMAHVDHGIRKNSSRDAQFVKKLAKSWDLPYQTANVSVPSHAAAQGLGLEEAGRELRYKALIKLADKTACSAIVTGHNADDQAETVLMNFLRGAGTTGLAGIPPVRLATPGIRLLRPLLEVSREDIHRYLKTHHVSYRQDPSNRSPLFTRNRIRHRVLPLLEQEYPGLKKRLAQTAEIFRDEQALWTQKIEREFSKTVRQDSKRITVDLPRLLGYHKALGRRILRHFLTGISFQDTERIFHLALSANGRLPVQLSGGLQVRRKGNTLIITRGLHE